MASLMPGGGVETFTGPDGSSWNWSRWYTGYNNNTDWANGGGYTTILSNRGTIFTGKNVGNRYSIGVNIDPRQDAEMVFDWVIPVNGDAYPRALMRSVRVLDTSTAYYFTLEANRMDVGRYNSSYNATLLTSRNHVGTTPGQIMRTRISVFGSRIKARTWFASSPEPTSVWQIDIWDGVITGPGHFGITQATNTSGQKQFQIDNFDLLDSETPQIRKFLHESWISPYGSFRKSVPRVGGGYLSPKGTLSLNKVVVREFSGVITVTGEISTGIYKFLSGAIRPEGGVTKTPKIRRGGSIQISATLSRRVHVFMNGTIRPRAETFSRNAGRIFGRPGIAIIKILKAGHARSRIRKG